VIRATECRALESDTGMDVPWGAGWRMGMFKKESAENKPTGAPSGTPVAQARPAAPRSGGPATIGPSIFIKGEVTGDEDLVVQGRIEGTVNLAKHNVTVGPSGKVTADVRGKTVVVEGEVVGDVEAGEQIVLRRSAVVEGNIRAPRVALEDGAVFRGGIEMDSTSKPEKGREPARPETKVAGGRDGGPARPDAPGEPAEPRSKSLTA
jgi:cytoskeletal protein CcmA (bactofilin family)